MTTTTLPEDFLTAPLAAITTGMGDIIADITKAIGTTLTVQTLEMISLTIVQEEAVDVVYKII